MPFAHRLSPSGLYLTGLGNVPGDVLTNVYKGFFPRGELSGGMPLPTSAPHMIETFAIPLPTVWPSTDPPEPFDPNKLLYLIWVNVIAYTDTGQATPGPASMTTYITVDDTRQLTTPIENVVQDNLGTFDSFAGTFFGRSSVHELTIGESVAYLSDVLNYTSLAVFRPGSIPAWVAPATPWVAGQTRHIYVEVVGNGSESGELWMPNHRSNIVIAEFYGDVIETIGLSSCYTPV